MSGTRMRAVAVAVLVSLPALALAEQPAALKLDNPLFAMETHFAGPQYAGAGRQAELLASLGYAGSDQTGLAGIAERLKAYDAKKLKLFGCYASVVLDPRKDPIPPAQVAEAVAALKDRGAVLWIALQQPQCKRSDPNGDEPAVKFLRELADAAAPAGVGVCLYPHAGYWLERFEDALRLAKKTGRKNVGVTFNLADWLAAEGGKGDLKAMLASAGPLLTRVTINGADCDAKADAHAVLPLDSGSYDVTKFLAVLKEIGYAGPIGLQGPAARTDAKESLSRSTAAWKKMMAGEAVVKVSAPASAAAKPPVHVPPATKPAGDRVRLLQSNSVGGVFAGATGNWKFVGEVKLDPKDDTKLLGVDGNWILFNGPAGKTKDLYTKQAFGDCLMHAEFMIPKGANSGLYLMGQYELQIYDSFGKETDQYPGIECGGIYPRTVGGKTGFSPKLNASKKPGEWQTFDVTFRAPRFDAAGKKTANACFVKVLHNGQLIHENVELAGPTAGAMARENKPTGPLRIQGDHSAVAFRALWVEPAKP